MTAGDTWVHDWFERKMDSHTMDALLCVDRTLLVKYPSPAAKGTILGIDIAPGSVAEHIQISGFESLAPLLPCHP
jgi:hypothetical protein